jgi:hypothetical protein
MMHERHSSSAVAGDSMTVTRKPRPCTSNYSMLGLLFILLAREALE